MCMKNLNKNYPFSLFYSFTIYCLNSQQHATTPPPYQITHVVSRLKPPRGITLIPTWGETERWGLYKQVSSFGWSFMRGAINHILTQSILLVSLTSSGPWKMKRRIMNPHLPPNAEFQGTLGSLWRLVCCFCAFLIAKLAMELPGADTNPYTDEYLTDLYINLHIYCQILGVLGAGNEGHAGEGGAGRKPSSSTCFCILRLHNL